MYFIIFMLMMLPFTFIFAGTDTDQKYAARVQHQSEATLEWTDKQILEEERRNTRRESIFLPEEDFEAVPEILDASYQILA